MVGAPDDGFNKGCKRKRKVFMRVDALLGEAMPMSCVQHKTFAELREGLLARVAFDARRSEF